MDLPEGAQPSGLPGRRWFRTAAALALLTASALAALGRFRPALALTLGAAVAIVSALWLSDFLGRFSAPDRSTPARLDWKLGFKAVLRYGLIGVGLWAAFFHVWNNSMTKGALFLSAGNIRRAAGGRTIDEVSGMSVLAPCSAALFVAGLFAVTACPPFGPFFSELLIVKSAFATGHGWASAFFLVCLLLAFFGLTRVVFAIVYGRPRNAARAMDPRFRETLAVIVPPVATPVA